LADGSLYGTLCAVDPEPRRLTPAGDQLLTVLARFLATQIERDLEIERRLATEREAAAIHAEGERSRGRMHAVLDAASDAMVLIDPGRRFRVINRRFAEMFGIDPQEVIGRRFEEFAPEVERTFEDAVAFVQAVAGSASDWERVFSIGVTQRWPIRRELQMFSAPVLGAGDEHLGRLYAFRDVTHEREVERLKTEFVSLVSHELRTPLTSIKGFVDLLFEFDVERLSADQVEFLTIVQSNVDRLVAIINDLLDISRIESGRLALDWSEFDLRQTIAEVVQSFQPQLATKRQQVTTVDLPPSLPFVLADRARVIQILTNLVSNAHKYSSDGSEIAVSAAADDRSLTIEVADTGIGMTAEELERLFDRFFRARNRTTQEAGGTGLGMTITRSLVEAMGGQIDVTSRPGEGTSIRFTLVAAAGRQRIEPVAMPWSRGTDGHRVLVVEDDPDNAELLCRHLERAGYEVLRAATGEDALLLIQVEQPDLVTLDVTLPDIDGFAVLERLRETLGPSALPPVLILSVLPDEGWGARLGAAGHLTKPIDEATLLSTIDEILNGPPTKVTALTPADTVTARGRWSDA
jgi:PAS domain S-box-containing protein